MVVSAVTSYYIIQVNIVIDKRGTGEQFFYTGLVGRLRLLLHTPCTFILCHGNIYLKVRHPPNGNACQTGVAYSLYFDV